jgi:hypothetical protein
VKVTVKRGLRQPVCWEAGIRLESSEPADGEAASEGIHQAFVRGNEFRLGGERHRDIKAVVETLVASHGDLQRLTQQVRGGDDLDRKSRETSQVLDTAILGLYS